MTTHTTNYLNAFIEVAEDCPVNKGEVPPLKGDNRSIANLQFEMISKNPYQYTSDDILFHCYAVKKELAENELEAERQTFFSKGQPCLRSSPLTKRYGWGIHNNEEGKVAVYGRETSDYKKLAQDGSLKVVKAMRSKKA